MPKADASEQVLVRTIQEWTEEDGQIVLKQRKFGRAGSALLRLFRLTPEVTIRLDGLGSEVWRLLDGSRTVAGVLDALSDRHPEETGLADRLGQYLSFLALNRLVRSK